MMKGTVFFLLAVFCTCLQTAHGFKCYQCDSYTALVNCTKVQTVVTCDSGVKECCTLSEAGTFFNGLKYKYFGKGCKGRKHERRHVSSFTYNKNCCGQSLCNSSSISQASFVLLSFLILVSKIILI